MDKKSPLFEKLQSLVKEYGSKDVVNHLNVLLEADEFYTSHVLHNLVRSSRKESLQLVGLVGNKSQNWVELPTFNLTTEEKEHMSGFINTFTYEQVLPGFFDPAVTD